MLRVDEVLWALTGLVGQTGAADGAGGADDVDVAVGVVEAPDGAAAAAGEEEAANGLADTATGVFDKITAGEFDQITAGEIWTIAQPILLAIVLIVVALIVAAWAKSLVVKACTKARVEVTLAKFFGNIAKWTVMVLAAVTILQTFGVEATSFAAVLAALGFAIGLALSGTLGNIAAGVMLLVFRPFRVGDVVRIADVFGKVDEIELFTTSIDTFDNRRFIVPNSSVFGSTIENISHHKIRRVDVNVGVAYDADIDRTRAALDQAILSLEARLEEPAHQVFLGDLGDSSVNWTCRVWVNAADFWDVKQALTRAIKMHLDEAGLPIPFPQRDVHLDGKVELVQKPGG